MGYQLIMDNQLISFTSNFYSKILFGFYILFVICPLVVDAQLNSNVSEPFSAVMLILVLFLKDFLRTYFKSLSWSLGVRSLSWSLWVRSLSLSWSLWSSPCPCL